MHDIFFFSDPILYYHKNVWTLWDSTHYPPPTWVIDFFQKKISKMPYYVGLSHGQMPNRLGLFSHPPGKQVFKELVKENFTT